MTAKECQHSTVVRDGQEPASWVCRRCDVTFQTVETERDRLLGVVAALSEVLDLYRHTVAKFPNTLLADLVNRAGEIITPPADAPTPSELQGAPKLEVGDDAPSSPAITACPHGQHLESRPDTTTTSSTPKEGSR